MGIFNEKVFYLIGGPNGSGKTTLARELIADKPDVVFLNSDDIAREQNMSPFDASRIILKQSYDIISNNKSFAWETTLAGHSHNKFIKITKDQGYKIVFLYVFLPSVEQNVARVHQRVALGGHDVPEEDIRRRYTNSLNNLGDVCSKADIWEIYNNGGKRYKLFMRGIHDEATFIDDPDQKLLAKYNARMLSKYLLDLANRGAANARAAALNAGVPIVYHER
ncbi:MAG: AAA family ATPase [Alphaproteobacteria bacterium]|nr:AAA family ATPase [Alphaproteobacteria bacterium]